MDTQTEEKHTFTTSRGVEVEFIGIATLLEKVMAAHNMPEPPTYTPKVADGFGAKPQPHFHRIIKVTEVDEESGKEREVEKEDTSLETPEDWAAWEAYTKALADAQATYNRDFMRTILLRGVKVKIPPDEDWVEEHQWMGLQVPEKPFQRKLHWLETELAGNVEDAKRLVTGVMIASGMDEEAIRDAENSFRGGVERDTPGQTAQTDSGNG